MIQLSIFILVASMLSLLAEHFIAPRHAAAFAFRPVSIRRRHGPPKHMCATKDATGSMGDREKAQIGGVPIISRTIPIEIGAPSNVSPEDDAGANHVSVDNGVRRLEVVEWEMDKPSDLIQEWWTIDEAERTSRVGDPFGVVMWPGSILASRELMEQHCLYPQSVANATVLVLGAGTGVEAQTAALLGAKKVVAADINPLTLKLLEYGANRDHRLGDAIEGKHFDLFSSDPLPSCDVLVVADVLYNPDLAKQVGRRLYEAIARSFDEGPSPVKVIVTDSQNFHGTNFLDEVAELRELNALFGENNWEELRWEKRTLENVRGSGVLVDEDQVYDVEARMISWGWRRRRAVG